MQGEHINWTRWFLLIGATLGWAFLVTMPPGGSPDERSHLLRVSTISDGWAVPPLTHGSAADYQIDGCLKSYISTIAMKPQGEMSVRLRNPECGPPADARATFYGGIVPMENYSPVPYAPATAGYSLGRAIHGPAGSLYGARAVQLATYLALVAVALRISPWGKPFLFAIALLPTSISAASGVSADAMTIAFAVLVTAYILKSIDEAHRRALRLRTSDLAVIAALLVLIALCKSVYVPMSLMVLALPVGAFGSRRRKALWSAGTIGAAATAAAAWTFGVVTRLATPNATATWVREQPLRLFDLIWHTLTTQASTQNMFSGIVAPLSPTATGPAPALFLVVVVLVALGYLRWVDPFPRRLDRRGFDPRRDVSAGFESVGSNDPGPTDAQVLGEDRVGADKTPDGAQAMVRFQLASAALAVTAAAASFLLIEYGLVFNGFTKPKLKLIWGLQGRYLLPLFPLALFGVNTLRARPAPRRWVSWLPGASTALLLWWLITLVSYFNGWL